MSPRIPTRSSVRLRTRVTAIVALACAAALGGAPVALSGASAAKKKVRLTHSKTFTLPAHTTKVFDVTYPSALKFRGAKYSCKAKASGLGRKHVKILSRGSALGGTVCRVKARNNAKLPSLDTTARVKVTATTTY
ncbi:MAG: hypothetical protein E6G56_10450 [Actinobacteria bacterium]|nr:MAG: hypothetical protein E6G56_10450 [Actinomycetota bacterium]